MEIRRTIQKVKPGVVGRDSNANFGSQDLATLLSEIPQTKRFVLLGKSVFIKSFQDAATNAAQDFCQYLVREGKMQQSDIPTLTSSSLEASSTWQDSETATMFCGGEDGNSFQESQQPIPQKRFPWSNNAYQRNEGTHEQYITQKAEEIAASETVDLKSEIHGGWTMENSKKALNEFLQKMRLPQVNYGTKIRESNTVK